MICRRAEQRQRFFEAFLATGASVENGFVAQNACCWHQLHVENAPFSVKRKAHAGMHVDQSWLGSGSYLASMVRISSSRSTAVAGIGGSELRN